MDELICVMEEILDELRSINSKLDDIRGSGNSNLDEVVDRLIDIDSTISGLDINYDSSDITGFGLDSTITDVCERLDKITDVSEKLDTIISMKEDEMDYE